MKNAVNVLDVQMIKMVQNYDLSTGEVGKSINEYSLFKTQVIISDVEPETIKAEILNILEKNCIDYKNIKEGSIFEESRITFQTFEAEDGYVMEKETEFFVDNDLYIEINNGKVSMEELQEIFPEIPLY